LDGDVLQVLARADIAMTGRRVKLALPEASYTGVRHVLDRLVREGIVWREAAGRAHLYRLNRDHLAAPAVDRLANLRFELIERLKETIGGWDIAPVVALLFGSAARGDGGLESDIDVLVLRPDDVDADDRVWREQIESLQASATRWTGNDTRVLEYDEAELTDFIEPDPVVEAAVREGVELLGSRRVLRKLRRLKSS
jgi:predicted nucleotidyltransferase